MALTIEQLRWKGAPEEWRVVPGLGGRYEVSTHGRLRRSRPARRTRAGRILKGHTTRRGYVFAKVYPRPERRAVGVHRLVAWAFLGPQAAGIEVNHIDGNPSNNAVWNLEYVTPKGNMRHAFRLHGPRGTGRLDRRGEKNQRAKLTADQVREIRNRYAAGGTTYPRLAERFGVATCTIAEIIRREKWRHV